MKKIIKITVWAIALFVAAVILYDMGSIERGLALLLIAFVWMFQTVSNQIQNFEKQMLFRMTRLEELVDQIGRAQIRPRTMEGLDSMASSHLHEIERELRAFRDEP